jgi:hypothetical protein
MINTSDESGIRTILTAESRARQAFRHEWRNAFLKALTDDPRVTLAKVVADEQTMMFQEFYEKAKVEADVLRFLTRLSEINSEPEDDE